MLVAIEGLTDDCRWQVVQGVVERLEAAGVPATAVPERVCTQLAASDVLADRPAAAAIAGVLAQLTDLYMADLTVIGPALAAGRVVVKDRHLDGLNYLARPDLLTSGAVVAEERAIRWLNGMATELRQFPDLAIYLDHDDAHAGAGWHELTTGVANTSTTPTPASVIQDLLRGPGPRRLLPVAGRPLDEVITAASALVRERIYQPPTDPLIAIRPGPPIRRRRQAIV